MTLKQRKNPSSQTYVLRYTGIRACRLMNQGTVQVSFYTADSAADYGVVIEGVCTSGNLIYSGEKVISRHSDSY